MAESLAKICRDVARRLAERQLRIVFAESCTAGLIAASLARVPGVSDSLCGSAVTYREATKAAWLDVSRKSLKSPGAVSDEVAVQMARGVLARTDEAHLAASVTGHLGPHAPIELDGVIYIGFAYRRRSRIIVHATRHTLTATTRLARQREATQRVLRTVAHWLAEE